MRSEQVSLFLAINIYMACLAAVAQDPGTLPEYHPITPNAAALFKNFEKPIATCTGIPPIGIPIHTCSYKEFSFPISLSYNAGGVKVEEYASCVGLGWNLLAGGMITRLQKGLPDEMGYLAAHYNAKPSQFFNAYLHEHLQAYSTGNYDTEPDLFLVNVNGITGKFVFNDSAKIYILEKSEDFRVEYSGGTGGSWLEFTITDNKGNKYDFNAADDPGPGSTNPARVAWHLTKVCDMNGLQLAKLEYESVTSYNEARSVAAINSNLGASGAGCTASDYALYDQYIGDAINEQVIKKITVGPEVIVFNRSNQLTGLTAKIHSIELKDTAGVVVKKFNLNFDYFGQPYPSGHALSEAAYNNRYRRLKLKNVSEQPATGADSITHTFTYEENVNLPERYSMDVDYWGYYNGPHYNTSIIPNGIYTYFFNTVGVTGYGDRRADPNYSKANTLTKITYPSGGYRQFEFEGNQALYRNTDYGTGSLLPDADDHVLQSFDTSQFVHIFGQPAFTRQFTVNSNAGYSFFYFNIEGYSSSVIVKLFRNGTLIAEFENEYNGYYFLQNDNYSIEVYDNYYSANLNEVHCWWEELSLTANTVTRYNQTYRKANQQVGGIRVKTIDDYDPVTNKHHYTRFKYNLLADTSLTSGMLVSYPRLLYRAACEGKDCGIIRLASQSNYPLNSDGGAYVVYPNVRVIEDGNGFTDSYYSFEFDVDWDYFSFPPPPVESKSNERGLLLSRRYFDQAGSLLRLDSTEYTNTYGENPPYNTCIGMKLVMYGAYNTNDYCYMSYSNNAVSIYQPSKEISTVYTPGGNYTTQTEYSYHYSLNKMGVNRVKVTNSDGSSLETWSRYPYNPYTEYKLSLTGNERAIKDTLLRYNKLQPLEVVSYLKKGTDSTFTGGRKVTYGYYNGKLWPATMRSFMTINDSTLVNFSKYDSSGNVLEQYITNGVKDVYLWGYNRKYVVAKVTGSDYNTVASFVSNVILQAPSSELALRAELNKIRTGLAGSNAQVTTYTYKPAIGVSSITDINGFTLYYDYDPYGRLVRIRDRENRIVRKYSYSLNQ